MENTEQKNSNVRFIGFLFLWFLLIGSLSYAYFSISFSKNKDDIKANVVSGKLAVDFETSQYIDNESLWPQNDSEVIGITDKTTFTVQRGDDSTVDNVYYVINLSDIEISDNYKSQYVKWALFDEEEPTSSSTPINQGNFSTLGNNTSLQLTMQRVTLPDNVTHTYSLYIWISNSVDQNQLELLNGYVRGRVEVIAVTE